MARRRPKRPGPNNRKPTAGKNRETAAARRILARRREQ